MNANELSLQLGFYAETYDGDFGECLNKSVTMLRQQQAEIEQCKREIDELYECLKEAVNNHKVTHLHPFWIEYRKRMEQEK